MNSTIYSFYLTRTNAAANAANGLTGPILYVFLTKSKILSSPLGIS
jgi:hypothetical protein